MSKKSNKNDINILAVLATVVGVSAWVLKEHT